MHRFVFKDLETVLRREPFQLSKPLTPETLFDQIEGWDSLKQLTLIVELETKFNFNFAPESLRDLKCLGDLVNCIPK